MYRYFGEVGLTFTEVLGIVFIILKLTNVIDWSWWWVLLPIYFPFAIFSVLVILFLIAYFIGGAKRYGGQN